MLQWSTNNSKNKGEGSMSSARHDYQKFLTWLHLPARGVSEDARRLANLVDANFDAVAASSRAQSRRSVVLAGIARESLPATDFRQPADIGAAQGDAWTWNRLHSLVVGPFRGFRMQEIFEFPRRVTMFSGPNGSGKTSLCEALELALLGSVDEATAKRIQPQRYFANLHERRYIAPTLTAQDGQHQVVGVIPDSDAYRFCFIEKNRIDNFSHIAAKTAGEKKDLIAALFGMEQFHEFVANFNESMDGQLHLVAARQTELGALQMALQRDQQIVNSEEQLLAGIANEEAAFAGAFGAGMTYAQLIAHIGSDQAPGRLHMLNAQLDTQAPALYEINSERLRLAYNTAEAKQAKLDETRARLAAKAGETSFQNLYNAVLGLQAEMPNNCPACGTPIQGEYRVMIDPYQKANEGLLQLRELAALQNEEAAAVREWETASRELANVLSYIGQRVGAQAGSQDARLRYLFSPGVDPRTSWWRTGFIVPPGGKSMAIQIDEMAIECERRDMLNRQVLNSREQLTLERHRLQQANQAVAVFNARRADIARQAVASRQTIENFQQTNAALFEAVRLEAEQLVVERRLKAAYDEFLTLLRQFRAELPGTLIAGLNTAALEIYNEFNRRDHESDKLAALHLPVNEDGRIEIAFQGAPQARVDALHVLSEGHVRCLGVAVLLAKVLAIRAPILIFDDAINAIDTEHREGIRETIFQGDRFAQTQIIVTCHSNEFIKDLQNHVPTDQWTAYYFMPHLGDHRPRVRGNAQHTLNYLLKAREAMDVADSRNALAAARQALEMITDKVWKWLGKNDLGQLTLPIAGRGAEPALRNLCEALKKRLDEAREFLHPAKPEIVQGLGAILGIPAPSNVWLYLNKGTHEEADRDDYDPNLVRHIVENLEMLNRLQLRPIPLAMAAAAQEAMVAALPAPAAGRGPARR